MKERRFVLITLAVALVLAAAAVSFAETTVKSGTLTADETWSGEVFVAATVVVPTGVTLTIAPGTTVKFRHYRGYKDWKVGLTASGGTIIARGTADRQIWFTSDADDPINGDWNGITMEGGSGLFDHVIVEYARIGIEQFNSHTDVLNSIIRWNNTEGLYAEASRARFQGNLIYGNAYHAIALENFNEYVEIIGNVIDGAGPQPVHIENSVALVEGNYFRNFDVSEDSGERALSVVGGGRATVRRNKFDIFGGNDPFLVQPGSTLIAEDNDFGDGHVSVPKLDYRDVRRTELGYLPGDPEDRYLYVFDAEDETRRVIARYGAGLGLGWSLAWAYGGAWRFTIPGMFVKIDPKLGVDRANEYANPTGVSPRGLAFDGEFFWANDHLRGKIVKFTLGTGGGHPDAGSGNAIVVLAEFDAPEREAGGGSGLATDGEYLYVPANTDPTKLYRLDKQGNIVAELRFEGEIGGAIAWDGEHFWSNAGMTINEWSPDGKLIGAIYPPAIGTWDLTWDSEHLWTINRTCENWDDAKVFEIEIIDATGLLTGRARTKGQ